MSRGKVGIQFKICGECGRRGIWQFVFDDNRPAILKKNLVRLGVHGYRQIWVRNCVHSNGRKESAGFLQSKKHCIQYTGFGRLGS